MKVYLSVDMEGGSGLTGLKAIFPGNSAYERFQKVLIHDVNAAIEGALKGGASEIVVNTAHDVNDAVLLIEELHPKVELITGSIKLLSMLEGLDQTFDAAFFIGYHARAGIQAAVLNHTMFFEVLNVRVNEELVGEFGLSTMVAGHFGVPVVLVTGDDKIRKEAIELLGNIETVVVKKGIDLTVAQCLPPKESAKKIKETAEKALTHLNEFKPYLVQPPLTFEVEFAWTSMAAAASWITGVTREDPRTISFPTQNILEGYQMLTAVLLTAKVASPRDILESM